MTTGGRTTEDDRFDMADWARDYGIQDSPSRATKLAELFGATPNHMREILRGNKRPSNVMMRLAGTLSKLAEVEAKLKKVQQERADAAIAHLEKMKEKLAISSDELMARTRGDDQ